MIVHRVVMPVAETVSWTVLGDNGHPVAPVETYLARSVSDLYGETTALWCDSPTRV